MGGVVWGTSVEQLRQFGINQILIPATTVIGASPFYHGERLDRSFMTRDQCFESISLGSFCERSVPLGFS